MNGKRRDVCSAAGDLRKTMVDWQPYNYIHQVGMTRGMSAGDEHHGGVTVLIALGGVRVSDGLPRSDESQHHIQS